MNDLETSLRKLLERCANKTLADLRLEAETELNGTVFESLRFQDGRRVFVAVCATGDHEIGLIEKALNLQYDSIPCDD